MSHKCEHNLDSDVCSLCYQEKTMDESLEREGYEHSNSLNNCQNCGARMAERIDGDRTLIVCPMCDTIEKETYEL